MSSRRIVASSIAMAAVLLATGLYGSSVFPLKAAPACGRPAGWRRSAQQAPPRDRRPGEAGPETARERELKQLIGSGTVDAATLLRACAAAGNARRFGRSGDDVAGATRDAAQPNTRSTMLAAFYSRTGRSTWPLQTLETLAAAEPSTPQVYQLLATFYWEKAFKRSVALRRAEACVHRFGHRGERRALAVPDHDYVDAIVYKSILLRHEGEPGGRPASRQALLARGRCAAQPRDGASESRSRS